MVLLVPLSADGFESDELDEVELEVEAPLVGSDGESLFEVTPLPEWP